MKALLLSLCLLAVGGVSARALDLYVATNGNDTAAGTLEAPLATLQAARDRVRASRKPGEAVTVQVRAGLYPLAKTLALEATDSGTEAAPVIYRGYGSERPILTGGLAITEWQPYRGEILQADIPAAALNGVSVRQLLLAGKRQPLARYPNFDPANPYGGGWAYAAGEMVPMYGDKPGEDLRTLQVKPEDWRTWARPGEVELFIFPRYNWWNDILRLKTVDPATHTVTTMANASYAMRANDRFYFQNALEELDAPGEWYFDKTAGRLYFWPPEPLGGRPVLVPRLGSIVSLAQTEHVRLQGLDFECCEETAVKLKDTMRCTVAACALRAVGGVHGSGVGVSGGRENGVIGCDISHTGTNGISLSGGEMKTLTPAGNFAENCYIHHAGVYMKRAVGVSLEGVGQRVAHCLIHDTPRFAIVFSGAAHTLEYNHLRHVALETEDVGATYCGGRNFLSPRGSVIRYNFIHDVLGFGWNGKWTSPYFAWGIYLDDNSGGVDVIGNIVARCGRSLLHGHSARDARVENNIFVEGGQRQWEFNGWTTAHRFWQTHLVTMTAGYESVAQEPAWQKLRGMDVHPRDLPDANGWVMSGNEFHRNLMVWKNPQARALNVANFDSARNHFDHNLYWHYGQPLLTGQRGRGEPMGENLVKNGGMEGAAEKLPDGWSWQIRPPKAVAGVAVTPEGAALRINAALIPDKPRENSPIIVSADCEPALGATYRLRARMRTDQPAAKASLMLQHYMGPREGKPAHFWSSSPNDAKLGPEWQVVEFIFNLPGQGDRGWHNDMKKFRVRLDWKEPAGSLWVDDVELVRLATKDEWSSWLDLGADQHSVIADPKFVAPEKDDYRLQPDSPAFALGFKPIPVEKIGPYQDPARASWPIVEAEGAREHPPGGGK